MKVYQFSHSRWIIHITRDITWMILCPSMYRYASAQSGIHPPEAANGRYTNLHSTTAIVVLVLISAMFIVAIFCLYLGYCSESCDDANALPSNATPDYSGKHGLDPAVIETFPIFIYRAVKDLKIGRGALECAVCLSEFEDDETVRLIPKCDHLFHYDCIDCWLASHVTCPVCRAELTSESNEKDQNLNNSAPEQSGSEEQSRVVIDINEEQSGSGEAQVLEISSTTRVNRPARSGVPEKFPRSHSTGHSLFQAGINVERYTLRLPEEVRKELMMTAKLKRTTSFNVFLATEGGSRKVGYNRSGGAEGRRRETNYVDPQGGRSDWWVFSMTPPFGPKMGSFDAANKIGDGGGGGGGAKGEGSSNGRNLLTAVKAPLNCLNVKVEQGGESSTLGPRLISLATNKK